MMMTECLDYDDIEILLGEMKADIEKKNSKISYSIRRDRASTSEEIQNEGVNHFFMTRKDENKKETYTVKIFYSIYLRNWFAILYRPAREFGHDIFSTQNAYERFSKELSGYLECSGIIPLDDEMKRDTYNQKYVLCKRVGKTDVKKFKR